MKCSTTSLILGQNADSPPPTHHSATSYDRMMIPPVTHLNLGLNKTFPSTRFILGLNDVPPATHHFLGLNEDTLCHSPHPRTQ